MPYVVIEGQRQAGRVRRLAAFVLLCSLALPLAGNAVPLQILSSSHVPAAVARLAPAGSLPGSERLNLAISLPLRNESELDALLGQLYDPGSTNYHRYLTPQEFTARFGPTESDYQAVMEFAKSNGLTVTVTHPNRLVLDVAGAVTDIARTFHLSLRVYRHPTEARDFYAPDVEPSVDLGVPILQVSGLDNYYLPHTNLKPRPAGVAANATPNAGSGPGGTYRGNDFRLAYVPGTSLTGAGQTVGLLEFDGYYASDITTYESQARLRNVPLTNVPVNGGVSTPGSGVDEVSLDIEMAVSMAPGLAAVYVYEAPNPSPWVDLLSRMANDNVAKQLSCSWGGGSRDASSEQIFKQMGAQGQSFFNATGDSDAFTGTIGFPSDSTNITEVGGTTLTTGTGAAYTSETVWNWGLSNGKYVGSSGGVSTYYASPSYQQRMNMTTNQGSMSMRNVPDVALTGDNVYVLYGNGTSSTFGGTSCAAPLWAGFTALVNQQAAAAGRAPVGFLNPTLYTIGRSANYASTFHDVTTGNNFWPSSPSKFAAVAGYDLCTGWGTPKGTNLINALAGPPVLAPIVVSNSFALAVEGCPNGAVDPAETVTVNFGLRNIGTGSTTNLVATLLSTGGVLSPSKPQNYGVLIANGPTVVQPFSFTATGSCGGTDTATIQLQDGAADLGTATFTFGLGRASGAALISEKFDGVTAPALPAGWTTSTSGSQSAWVTSTSASDTTPNSVFAPDPASVGVNELDSPTITLPAGSAQLTFRNNYNLEASYDGGVLEIKVGGGSWTDIVTAGGSFVSGGYNYTLSSSYSNPLAGRQAWSGSSGGFITTLVNLPAAASGQSIQLRWRCGSDSSISGTGWYVDSVSVTNTTRACCTVSTDLGVSMAGSPDPVLAGETLTYTLTVINLGSAAASGVTLTDALPASATFVSASPGCVNTGGNVVCSVGSLPGGGGTNFTVVVIPTMAGQITNTLTVASPTTDTNSANNTAASVTTVYGAPSIVFQPASRAVIAGADATFQVAAGGTAPLGYQWRLNGTNLADAVNATLTLTNVQAGDAGNYTVLVTNAYGSVLSSNAVLTVLDPWIVAQPKDESVTAGAPASFTVSAIGTLPLSYQWLKEGIALLDGTNLSGALTATLTVAHVQAADMGNYSVAVSNINGRVVSTNATLVADFPSSILAQPANQTVLAGGVATFTAGVVGSNPMSFNWQREGTNLADGGKFSGTASASLVVSNVQSGEMGDYSLVVSNTYGSVTSSNALLSVWPLLGWGQDDHGQADIPGGLTGVTSIAAGLYHSLALRADGTVTAWGAGRTNADSNPDYGQAIVPARLSNVVAVAGGAFHSLALSANGMVAAWGAGTTNDGIGVNDGQSVVPSGLSHVAEVTAGYYDSTALRADGTVVGWGDNRYGQTDSPAGLSGVVAVASGAYHNLALKADGTVVAWGDDSYGQTNVPAGLTNVVAVAAGFFHSLALKADGTVVAWGGNSYGQTNVPVDLTNGVAVAAGFFHSLALKADGTVVAWGDSGASQSNIPAGLANVVEIAGGGYHDLALENDGRPALTVQPYSQVAAAGTTATLAAMAVGAQPLAYQWQFNGTNIAGATTSQLTLPDVQISSAGAYAVIITNALGVAKSYNAILTVPAGPGTILAISQAGASVCITFASEPGVSYLLEYKNSLGEATWTPLSSPVAALGTVMMLQDTNAPANSRYYRLRSQ